MTWKLWYFAFISPNYQYLTIIDVNSAGEAYWELGFLFIIIGLALFLAYLLVTSVERR